MQVTLNGERQEFKDGRELSLALHSALADGSGKLAEHLAVGDHVRGVGIIDDIALEGARVRLTVENDCRWHTYICGQTVFLELSTSS